MTIDPIYNHEFGNKTNYGIESDAVRYTWAAYYLFVIASSWIGDSIILVASIKYKAIKLHRVVVGIIQHIAVCDLMLATVNALVRFVSLIAERWVFGRSLCYVATYVHYFTKSASIFLICAMATFKVLLLKYPLTFRTTSRGAAHRICALCWVAALILPGAHLIVDSTDEFFNYVIYQCYFGFTKTDIWSYLRPLLGCLIILPPSVTIVAASIYLLVIANRVARAGKTSLNWQGTVTIILTAGIYILSYLPYFVSLIIESLVDEETARGEAFIAFYRIALTLLSFNTFSNFFVYCLAVHSFRSFVSSKIFRTKQTEKGMESYFENYLSLDIYLRFTQ